MRKTDLPPWVAEAIATLPPLARAAEVAAVLRVKAPAVKRLIALGQLDVIRSCERGSARVLIPRDSVGRYLARLEGGTSHERDTA